MELVIAAHLRDPSQKRETLIFIALMTVICALALAGWWLKVSDWLEAVSFVTGAACVWLTVREKVWNFPISLLNAVTYAVVFFRSHLFADGSLQVVYFILTAVGWYLWLWGGEGKTALRISTSTPRSVAILCGAVAVTTLLLWRLLQNFGGSASFWDALTASISLGAQWLLNKKKVENWVFWIVVNVIYIPLYIYKDLYLTAVLYLAFLIMAVFGLKQWRASMKAAANA